MSYNTRRSQTGFGNQSSNVGQRRPQGVSNNFVSGGQLSGIPQQQQQQYKPQGLQQQQRPPQQQQQQSQQQNVRNQNQMSFRQVPTPQKPPQQQQSLAPVKNEPVAVTTVVPKPIVQQVQPPPLVSGANPPAPESQEAMETNAEGNPKKRFWPKSNKISRSEKVRRRNMKLSKILQPKNAVMILNELVKGCVYTVEELPVKIDVNQFRGTVTFDGQEFAGTGKNKIAAKNAAAETALKHLVKNKKIGNLKKEEDEVEKMDVSEEGDSQVMPWSHIASFAMYKLFSAWGEDPNTINQKVCEEQQELQVNLVNPTAAKVVKDPRPAKKMPDHPETMNPLMLMHQMLPNAVWDEVGKSGNPPNIVFMMKVTIGDRSFTGTGSNKKTAKKMAAFAACNELLNVNYPPEIWVGGY